MANLCEKLKRLFFNASPDLPAVQTITCEDNFDELRELGKRCLDEERLDEAVDCFAKIQASSPNSCDARINLGFSLFRAGRYREAVTHLAVALELDENSQDAVYLLGLARNSAENLEETIASLQGAIATEPGFEVVYPDLCQALRATPRLSDALSISERLLAINPSNPTFHHCRGKVLYLCGRIDEAILQYRGAIDSCPGFAEAYSSLAKALFDLKRYREAQASSRDALKFRPDDFSDYAILGLSHLYLGEIPEAISFLKLSLQLHPESAASWHALGDAYRQTDNLPASIDAYQSSLSIEPRDATFNNMGISFQMMGQFEEARAAYSRALELKPDSAAYVSNLASLSRDCGLLKEAMAGFEKALALDPSYVDALGNLLFVQEYAGAGTAAQRFELYCRYGELVSRKVARPFDRWFCETKVEKLRVGLVSGDLRNHPVGYFVESIIEQLNHADFELIAYVTCPVEDELTQRLKPKFRKWQRLFGYSDEEAARLIHDDAVHVLIDLSGHTAYNRLPIFAWKPAPIQASWLGYFATTGVREMDYLLADPVSVPMANSRYFTEKILYFPETRLCFSVPQQKVEVTALPSLVKNQGRITFGCFQNLTKVGDHVLTLWGKVFSSLPEARLRWQAPQFASKISTDRELARLESFGIHSVRVHLCRNTERQEYLEAHGEVDIILDTFPYPGGTTTCEALWMGVPTLTLIGDTMLSRQGASLLTAAGLPEWVACTEDEYVAKAIAFARDLDALRCLREGLRQRVEQSSLFDAKRFAGNFERMLWDVWEHRARC